ncbi:G-type lectin S-receptor-like Serine/Threonine-kinase [Medicago truncatula]|uniref:Receptor-like serine/threonine-protein kinase n=1 Tax=Medicago truncatula TaxID=3880 RepID=A0A072UA87_MEDTR|nr:G-type lectin S-receptor-like Serine/Threonine-kinase [Medicago truncatula]
MGFSSCSNLFFVLFILFSYLLRVSIGIDTITSSQFIKDPETLLSKDGSYAFGFFSPENSTNRYVGIWWNSRSTVVWVANRNQPLNDSNGIVTISEDGNIEVLNGQKRVIWSSNVSNIATNTSSQFSDYGNLVLLENATGNVLWQSIQQPTDTLLSGMKLSINKRTGEKSKLTSWKSPSDPSVGIFSSSSVERGNILEVFIWNETRPYWRSGPWNGGVFTGIDTMTTAYFNGFQGGDDGQGNINIYFTMPNNEVFLIYNLNSQGKLEEMRWNDEKKEVEVKFTSQKSECDVYGICGAFAICNSLSTPICSCLKGFDPINIQEWNRNNWTSGCVRRRSLQCERVNNKTTSTKEDGFLKLQMVKVPDFAEGVAVTPDICRSLCLENCSCTAYSNDAGIGCMSWTGNLLDIQQLESGGLDLYFRVPETELGMHALDKGTKKTIIITIIVILGTLLIVICGYIMWRRISKNSEENNSDDAIGGFSQVKLQELLVFDFGKLATATNNFHLSNKLGEGGFGPVYKGKLQDGQEIAVKRLSRASGQGLEEFMNEVVVLCKLQHRNLVRLLGCCTDGDEKMLMYEYMPNKSLDAFIFDPSKSKLLDWRTRYNIIEGIARGLLYLHRDSRLRIIHRDLKTSNILLDEELNPKISDFGMARIFGGRENQANTTRVVGTYGYMSPEYAMRGLFSEKSDVFSFGVLILEIVSGRRNSSFYDNEHAPSLLGFVWIQWREENMLSLIDPEIYDHSHHTNILRCIHIGLLCVQESAVDRPTMATVISMLISEDAFLPPPSQPAFILRQNTLNSTQPEENQGVFSSNTVSITDMCGR